MITFTLYKVDVVLGCIGILILSGGLIRAFNAKEDKGWYFFLGSVITTFFLLIGSVIASILMVFRWEMIKAMIQ